MRRRQGWRSCYISAGPRQYGSGAAELQSIQLRARFGLLKWEECSCNSPVSEGYSRQLSLRLHGATDDVMLPRDVEHGRPGDIIKVRIIKQGKVITSGATKPSSSRIPPV